MDLTWVALSPFIALLIRDNFIISIPRHQALIPYALLCIVSAGIVFTVARLHQTVWRYISLPDVSYLIAGVTIAVLVALVGSFIFNRLEGVARSLPVIQWLVLIAAMIGTRITYSLIQERIGRRSVEASSATRHVLIVGITPLTELYLRSIAEFGPTDCAVVGILSRGVLRGRLLRQHRVLGAPEDVQKIIAQLELHGVAVERIIVMQPFEQLSKAARQELLVVERSSAIKVDWLVERLGLREGPWATGHVLNAAAGESQTPPVVEQSGPLGGRYGYGRYGYVKRAIDIAGTSCLLITLGPFVALLSLLVAIDVGLPLVFWQQRPGRHGRPIKLYKFRTMHAAHDAEGCRIPDELRSSKLGRFLRRCRFDEVPQLYNVLMGEMSFVGPRPLLPLDQPKCQNARLMVRPGLTGWAQVNGGRKMSPEDKAALDIWYITHASLWLDVEILLRTLVIMVLGDRENSAAVKDAHAGLREPAVGDGFYAPLGRKPSPAQATN
jgi:lipopolysaccharide/colanic/teichoic acid biosynthesis glycosyltransferase